MSSLRIGSDTVGLSSILKDGIKSYKGLDQATLRNIHACLQLGDLIRTSFGPAGRSKLVLNSLDKLFLTSNAQTMLKEAGIDHPAAKLLMEVAVLQKSEFGDASSLVVVLGAAILSRAADLLQQGLRPSDIREGFLAGEAKILELLDGLVVENITPEWQTASQKVLAGQLFPLLKTIISSKHFGEEDFLANLTAEALAHAVPCDHPERFDLDNVRIVKVLGGSIFDSKVIYGLVLNRCPTSRIQQVAQSAKVAVFSCPIDIGRTEAKGTVLLKSAEQMLNFSKDEEDSLERDLRAIADSGAQILVTSDAVGDMALHFINRLGLIVLRVPSKFDIRRIVRATGAQPLTTLVPPKPEQLGTAGSFKVIEIGGDFCTVIESASGFGRISSILLRGSSTNKMDDYERTLIDSIAVAKTLLGKPDGKLVPGAGASEMELAHRLSQWTLESGLTGLPLLALQKFSQAFTTVAEVLAENAGFDPVQYMATLETAHVNGRIAAGVHPDEPQPVDTPVRDLLIVKRSAIRYACRVAWLLLGVDQIIMAKPAVPGLAGSRPAGNLDAD
jgi:T-complex protein 1 subunit theta